MTFDIIISIHDIANLRLLVDEFISSRTLALEWLKDFTKEEFVEKLKTKDFRDKIRKIYDDNKLKLCWIHTKADPFWMERFKIITCQNQEYEGKTIAEITEMKNADPLETIFDILLEDPDTEWFQFFPEKEVMFHTIPVFLNHPAAMPSTDMGILPPITQPEGFKEGDSFVYPSSVAYGAFTDYIGTYVREKSSLSLEVAVKKATSFPAQRFGIKDRGVLKPGNYADIVVFDFEKIKKAGDFMKPAQRPEGIEYVIINGKVVYKDKTHTEVKSGKVLRHMYN